MGIVLFQFYYSPTLTNVFIWRGEKMTFHDWFSITKRSFTFITCVGIKQYQKNILKKKIKKWEPRHTFNWQKTKGKYELISGQIFHSGYDFPSHLIASKPHFGLYVQGVPKKFDYRVLPPKYVFFFGGGGLKVIKGVEVQYPKNTIFLGQITRIKHFSGTPCMHVCSTC